MCVCWCLCAFERSSNRGLVKPGCQKNGVSSPGGPNKGFRHRAPTNARGGDTKGTKTHCPSHTEQQRGYMAVSRSVKYAPSGITVDMFSGSLVAMCWILSE